MDIEEGDQAEADKKDLNEENNKDKDNNNTD